MELAACLMMSQMAFMLVVSPLGMISPSALLAGSWAFVFILQSIFATDMNSSILATAIIFTITLSFSVGEFIGCKGLGMRNIIRVRRSGTSTQISDNCDEAKRYRILIFIFVFIIIIGVVEYAKVMGLLKARSLAELIILPGIARAEMYAGDRDIPLYSRVGFLLAYPSVVLSLAYYHAYRWRWWLVLPMIGVLLLGMSQSGRAGTFIVLVQLVISVYLKNILVLKESATKTILKCTAVPGAIMSAVFIGGQFLREGFHSTETEDVIRVVYTLRGYLFGGVSAFSYWVSNIYDWKLMTLGKYSFSSLFSALGIARQEIGIYDTYMPIASNGETSNIYTAYRSFIDDYSILGACLLYLVAGIVIASITCGIIKGKGSLILVLVPLLSWLALSPMFSATYFNSFLLSCILPYFLVKRFVEVRNADHQIHMC